jgi:hypothetical protein
MALSLPDDSPGRKSIAAARAGDRDPLRPTITGLNDHGLPLTGRRTKPAVIFPPVGPGSGRTPRESRETRPQLRITGRQPWTSLPDHKRQWLAQHGWTRETYDAGITSSPYTPRFDPAGFIAGDRIGRLTVTENLSLVTQMHDYPCHCTWGIPGCGMKVAVNRYLCRCDCGTERIYSGGNLATGQCLSCGCSRLELAQARQRRTERIAGGPDAA